MFLPLVCEYLLVRDPVTLFMHDKSIMSDSSESADFDLLLERWISAKMAESSGQRWPAISSSLFKFWITIPDALFKSDVTTGGGKSRSRKSALIASAYPVNVAERMPLLSLKLTPFLRTSSKWLQSAGIPVHLRTDQSYPLFVSI